jgi:glycosyltransferase involved in cell wall biosynthesis
MHLLYLSSFGGGLETNVRVLSSALIQAGHRVSILYLHSGTEPHINGHDQNGLSVYYAEYGDWHYYFNRLTFGMTGLSLVVRAFESARACADKVREIHRRTPIDLVEVPEIALPLQTLPVPYVVRLHSQNWLWRMQCNEPGVRSDSIEKRLEGATLRRASAITAPSRIASEYIRHECGLDDRPIQIISYPVDTEKFKPAPKDQTHEMVLFVGRVEKRKGADVLLRAIPRVVAKHPDCEFLFVGQVSDELVEMVKKAPGAVRFLSFKPRHELIELYQQASICVVPSLWDNSPNVVYESMACGTPVVASSVGGIPELIEQGLTGTLVPRQDEDALGDAINSLLDSPGNRSRMGARCREKAISEWTVNAILERTLQVYRSALASE